MTNYVVFRVAKLKSRGNIAGAAAHNLRQMSVQNADPERRKLNMSLAQIQSRMF